MAEQGETNAPIIVESDTGAERESVLIDCTKSNFLEQSNDFIKRLPEASWVALDEEMTGIRLPQSKKPAKDETPADRYSSLKLVPERYSIIQLGICLFQKVSSGDDGTARKSHFHVRRYKFTLFPPSDSNSDREIVLSPGSVRFLAEENNCDLNSWIQDGIPYCTGDTAVKLLDKFRAQQLVALSEDQPKPPETPTKKLELTNPADKGFHARAMGGLREWLDSAVVPGEDDPEGASMLLPGCNSYLRRALYESIRNEYPHLVLETVPGGPTAQIRVWRLSPSERKLRTKRLLKEGWEKLVSERVGAWRVFLALANACGGEGPKSQAEHMILSHDAEQAMAPLEKDETKSRKIPLVVHNGLQDLLFLLTHFHSPTLPEKWEDCKELIHSYFPVIYDTKTMASEYCLRENSRARTHLSAVYEQILASHPQWQPSSEGDRIHEQAHDAAFDAYMTGVSFCGLSHTIQDQSKFPPAESPDFALWDCDDQDKDVAWFYGRNKIHFYLSPYTIDLEAKSGDPLSKGMSPFSTFSVADIDPSVTTRDIVTCLTGFVDSSGRRVNFEIIWVDDTKFLVGAMLPDCQEIALFKEHGRILLKALTTRFQKEVVEPLQVAEDEPQAERSLWNLWGLFGQTKRPRDEEGARPSKRRRVDSDAP